MAGAGYGWSVGRHGGGGDCRLCSLLPAKGAQRHDARSGPHFRSPVPLEDQAGRLGECELPFVPQLFDAFCPWNLCTAYVDPPFVRWASVPLLDAFPWDTFARLRASPEGRPHWDLCTA